MHHIAKLLIGWLLISFLSLISPFVNATAQFKHIKGFSIDDGLPSATIYSIVELPSGKLLIGTDRGVARYDGYSFEVFSKQRGNLTVENASNIFIDAKQNVWIGSWGDGLAIYDKHFNLLHHHSPTSGFPKNIQAFHQDSQGTVWAGSSDAGLIKFKGSIKTYKQYRHHPEFADSPSDNRIWEIIQLDPQHLWLATNKGLNRFNIDKEKFEHFIPEFLTNLGVVDNIIRTMLPSPDKQKMLVGANRNLAIFDINKQQFSALNIENTSLNLGFNEFSYTKDGELLLASIVGLFQANTQDIFANDGRAVTLSSTIDDTDIRDMLITKNNLLWAATRHSGLIKLNIIDNPVTHINQFISSQGEKQLIGHIYSFFKDSQDTIWIGSRTYLTYLTKASSTKALSTKASSLPKQIPLKHSFNRISSIAQTPQGQLIVRDSLGTYLLNKDNDDITPFEFITPNKRLNHQTIDYIHSHQQQLWIMDDELSIYRINKDGYSQSMIPKNSSNRVRTNVMYTSAQQQLWLTLDNLNIWHQHDKELFDFEELTTTFDKTPIVNQIIQDKQGKFYFASMEGLLVYNAKTLVFEKPLIIPNYDNEYQSAIFDDQNNLWAANDDRIIQMQHNSDEKNIYGFLDGLNVARYQKGAAIKDAQGRLLFGGADGIDILEPQNMNVNTNQPNVIIGNIKVNNNTLKHAKFNQDKPMILASNENDINFEFTAIELKQPRLNQYKYKLEGFDQHWSEQSNDRYANYVNLPAGDYTMLYTGSNNSRVWNPDIQSFKFTVEQSFFDTIYFYGLVLMSLFTLFYLYAIYNARFHRRRRQFLQSQINAKTQDLTLLSNIGQKLSACLDDKSIFELLYKHLSERFDTQYFGIALYDKTNNRIQYQHVIENGKQQPSYHIDLEQSKNLSSWCISAKQEVIIESPEDIERYLPDYQPTISRDIYNSMLYMPLLAIDNQVTGCLTIQSQYVRAYTHEQISIARTLASYTAVALNNAQAYSQLEKQNQAIIAAQQQLVQSEKMASLGELTAGVAHEINNPTNFVSVSCQNMSVELTKFQNFVNELIEEDADQEILDCFAERFDELFSQLDTMADGSQRIKTIVQDLRAFSRLEVVERQEVVLRNTVKSTLHLIKTKFIDNVEFLIDIDKQLTIECNQSQFNQVLMNIIVNGCDAILESEHPHGTITIAAKQQAENAVITIKDNGFGMDEPTQQKVFEPFFTTKPVGKGTGLGLSISFGIIKDHQGNIEVSSEVGKGTCFTITIPLQQKATD